MSTYQGWNQVEVMGQRNVQPSNLSKNPTEHATEHSKTSFTEINRNNAPVQFISSMRTLRELDATSLYNLPEETKPSPVTTSHERKRRFTQSSRGWTTLVAWDLHSTTEDQASRDQEGSPDGRPRRNCKPATAKRSKSAQISSNTIAELWDSSDINKIPYQNQEPIDEQSALQLTTPPDSGKRAKRRAKSSNTNVRVKKTGPFKVLTITKPSAIKEKEPAHIVARSQPISTHQGWTTTEDAIKSTPNAITIAKTTLDRLVAFRYKTVGEEQTMADPQSPLQTRKSSSIEGSQRGQLDPPQLLSDYDLISSKDTFFRTSHLQELPAIQLESPSNLEPWEEPTHPSSDYGRTLDGSEIFADTNWYYGSRSNPIITHRLTHCPAPETISCAESVDLPQKCGEKPQTILNANVKVMSQEDLILRDTCHHHDASDVHERQDVTDFEEPNSSEIGALNRMLDKAERAQKEQSLHQNFPEAFVSDVRDGLSIFEMGPKIATQIRDDSEPVGVGTLATRYEPGIKISEQLPELQGPRIQGPKNHALKPQNVIQVERSDIDLYEPIPSDVLRDFEIDEFDEGLDDSELLRIISHDPIPETQAYPHVNQSDDGVAEPTARTSLFMSPAIDTSKNNDSHGAAVPAAEISCRSVFPQILDLDLDDEYPMDECDEEEMRKLPELTAGVTERFQAPLSLQYSFADHSDEGYDRTLQFSPPKSILLAASPSKIADCTKCFHTDSHRACSSPTPRSELNPHPLNNEDEWSFIRSTKAHDITERQTTPDLVFELPKRVTASRIDRGPNIPSLNRASRQDSLGMTQSVVKFTSSSNLVQIDNSHENEPLNIFARPNFPVLIRDRCPVIGLSAQNFLRTCFRIGEMYKEGKRFNSLSQDAVIELFARVNFSSRDPGTTKQHFHFADLFNDRPPFPHGILMNYKTTGLADTESKVFLDTEEGKMARCLGRLKRDARNVTGWLLHVITIRETNWEEIRYTKRVVSADGFKSETVGFEGCERRK